MSVLTSNRVTTRKDVTPSAPEEWHIPEGHTALSSNPLSFSTALTHCDARPHTLLVKSISISPVLLFLSSHRQSSKRVRNNHAWQSGPQSVLAQFHQESSRVKAELSPCCCVFVWSFGVLPPVWSCVGEGIRRRSLGHHLLGSPLGRGSFRCVQSTQRLTLESFSAAARSSHSDGSNSSSEGRFGIN